MIVDTKKLMFPIVNDIHTCMFFEVVNREYPCIMMGFWLIYWLRCPVNHEIGPMSIMYALTGCVLMLV